MDQATLDDLVVAQMNGREIKNLIKSAHLLALDGDEKIAKSQLVMLAENCITALEALSG